MLLVCSLFVSFSAVRATVEETAVVVDSHLEREQALANKNFPKHIVDAQDVVTVRYFSFDGKIHEGQIVVHKELSRDVKEIFEELRLARFPIKKVVPIVRYNWSDDASIADNNTSAFNYRTVSGTRKLSDHAYGRAIDVNPYLNPWVGRRGVSSRPYNTSVAGTIASGDVVVKAFTKRGWKWGGSWKHSKDYQHFSKGGTVAF